MRILQGNSRLARNNVKLGGLDLMFTQAQHRTEVSFTFSIRDASILHVSAYNTASPSLTHTIEMHALKIYAYEMHAHEMHALEMHAHEMHSR
jgi:hypothetical protein